MMKIVVSACLLGVPVRYDGRAQLLDWPVVAEWQRTGRLVPFCPEVAGGLPTPRPPAECQTDGRILTCAGDDVTAAFRRGAEAALALWRSVSAKGPVVPCSRSVALPVVRNRFMMVSFVGARFPAKG